MIITQKHLNRRTVLKGLGATIALPLLDAMTPALAKPVITKAPVRLAFTYVPNGVTPADWMPAGVGRDFTFSRILKPLEPYRHEIAVLSGLAHKNGRALGDGPGDHARAAASYLTGVHPKKTAGADIRNGISVDQIVAQHLASESRFPSIELGCEDTRTVGNCDSGYSCAYTNSLSWRGPSSPNPPVNNPRLVFERLFGLFDAGLDPETRARRMRYRRSVLDLVAERTQALTRDLGASDRRKVDEYLTSVRAIEQRIEAAERDNRELLPSVEKPSGIPPMFADHVRLMFDLQILAFQANLTRVATMMIGREGSMRTYPEIGVPDPHHPLTHHGGKTDWVEKVTKINEFHMQLFAEFVAKMKATPDGDGSLLDHSMIVYGSGLADGDRHTHDDLPVLLVGRGGGSLRTGHHVVYPSETPMTNLYLTLLDRMGVREETIGDSTGKVEHLAEV
jgi:hypothetical protein